MTVQAAVHHIACCNVCGKRFDDDSPYLFWSDSPEQAVAWVADDDHWTLTGTTVVCPISNPAHNTARGSESPALLEAGPDAMNISYRSKP